MLVDRGLIVNGLEIRHERGCGAGWCWHAGNSSLIVPQQAYAKREKILKVWYNGINLIDRLRTPAPGASRLPSQRIIVHLLVSSLLGVSVRNCIPLLGRATMDHPLEIVALGGLQIRHGGCPSPAC